MERVEPWYVLPAKTLTNLDFLYRFVLDALGRSKRHASVRDEGPFLRGFQAFEGGIDDGALNPRLCTRGRCL
jgi:hypothetical protein